MTTTTRRTTTQTYAAKNAAALAAALTVDQLLTTLDDLALQALQASSTHGLFGSAEESQTLKDLAQQVRRLVQAADQQINV